MEFSTRRTAALLLWLVRQQVLQIGKAAPFIFEGMGFKDVGIDRRLQPHILADPLRGMDHRFFEIPAGRPHSFAHAVAAILARLLGQILGQFLIAPGLHP